MQYLVSAAIAAGIILVVGWAVIQGTIKTLRESNEALRNGMADLKAESSRNIEELKHEAKADRDSCDRQLADLRSQVQVLSGPLIKEIGKQLAAAVVEELRNHEVVTSTTIV